jgi:hypothetical protein
VPLVLGREYAVHGAAACVLRRLPNQNLLVLGGSAAGRIGMLGGIVASAVALAPDVLSAVRVLDLSGDPAVASVLHAAGPRLSITTDPVQAVAMLQAPQTGSSELLVMIEPDRAVNLLWPTDPVARPPATEALERRLRDGPLTGQHTVLVCTGLAALNRVLGRRGPNAFAWRAVTQISQDDSQDLLANRMGSQLSSQGRGLEAALLADKDGNRFTRFMPYAAV